MKLLPIDFPMLFSDCRNAQKFLIVGITGALGCGKSTVTAHFAQCGFATASADVFCREFYVSEAADELRTRWGETVFLPDGTVNYAEISRRIFRDSEEMKLVSSLIYRYVERRTDAFLRSCREKHCPGVVEIPLLFEHSYEKKMDVTLTVWCDASLRHARLKKYRNFDDEGIRSRESRQLSPEKKLELADFALINNGSIADLDRQIDVLIAEFKK